MEAQLGGTKPAESRRFVIISVARDFNKMFVWQLDLASQHSAASYAAAEFDW